MQISTLLRSVVLVAAQRRLSQLPLRLIFPPSSLRLVTFET